MVFCKPLGCGTVSPEGTDKPGRTARTLAFLGLGRLVSNGFANTSIGFTRFVSFASVQVAPVVQKSTANCPGRSNVKDTELPLTVGTIRAWLGRMRAEVKGLLFVTFTVTAPANENDVQEVACSRVDELVMPLGWPFGKKPGFWTW